MDDPVRICHENCRLPEYAARLKLGIADYDWSITRGQGQHTDITNFILHAGLLVFCNARTYLSASEHRISPLMAN